MVEVEMEIDVEGNVVLKAFRESGEKPVCTLVQQLISTLSDSGADVTKVTMDDRVHGHHHDFEVRRRA